MNQNQQQQFVPVVTTEAGACLTLANWQEAGTQTLAYYLDAWLMKPGYALLNSLSNIRSFCAWKGTVVLNATLPTANVEGVYRLRSRYDGSLIEISSAELVSLIIKLAPDFVILPPGLAADVTEWPESITPFIPVRECSGQEYVYLSYEQASSFADFLVQFKQLQTRPCYLSGNFDRQQAQLLSEEGALWLESDKPANDAFMGLVYDEEQPLNILDSAMAQQHQPISLNCACPTCTQRLTRAYLHHLLQQTPLLCQRFLIQHNAYRFNSLSKNHYMKSAWE